MERTAAVCLPTRIPALIGVGRHQHTEFSAQASPYPLMSYLNGIVRPLGVTRYPRPPQQILKRYTPSLVVSVPSPQMGQDGGLAGSSKTDAAAAMIRLTSPSSSFRPRQSTVESTLTADISLGVGITPGPEGDWVAGRVVGVSGGREAGWAELDIRPQAWSRNDAVNTSAV